MRRSRITLRPFAKSDYDNWAQSYSILNPAHNRWDESPWKSTELTPKKFQLLLREHALLRKQDHTYHFGVFRQDDGLLIGQTSLMDISRNIFQNAYLGYRIFTLIGGLKPRNFNQTIVCHKFG